MTLDYAAFAFIITLAAVVNGLGIVRWLAGFAEYLRRRQRLQIQHYWVFSLFAGFQFLMHILLWWSLWSVRGASAFNFLTYLYLLTGPILLYLGTSLLAPNLDDKVIDLRAHYFGVQPLYFTILVFLWVWSILLWPVLQGGLAPTAPIFTLLLVTAVTLRVTRNPRVHGAIAVINWLLAAVFVAVYATELGGVGKLMSG